MTPADRLEQQLAFLDEADRLKSVVRGTPVHDGSRRENSAEHSWHVALYALVLAEHAQTPIDIEKVIRMLLIHDVVEIDAGDVPIHGTTDPVAQAKAEISAADRLFGLLPADQAASLRALWDEFEAASSPEAVFAKSIDRVQPVLANLASGGGSWKDYDVTRAQLEDRVGTKVRRGAPRIWQVLQNRLDAWFR